MSKFILTWETGSDRKEAIVPTSGLEIQGKELRVPAAGITNAMLAGSITDDKLNQITTANKVAGSAVELQSVSAGGLANDSGLGLVIDTDMFSFEAVSGLQLDYDTGEFQFIPGEGLNLNVVPTSKLQSDVVLTDGTRAFTAPQAGVDAVNANHLTTLSQVQSLVTGDFGEDLLSLAGRDIIRGEVGYVESVSGSFRLALADDPATAIVQYVAREDIIDGASGGFQNPSTEIDEAEGLVSGFDRGAKLFLSTTEAGKFQVTAPSVSGLSILECGWKVKEGKFVFFPSEAIDL